MAQLVITPQMNGKIVDESHFSFHVTCKAKIANAVNKMKDGVDFLNTISKLNLTTDKRWVANDCKDPSVTALLDILEEYKRVERRPSRAKVLIPLLEYAIGLYASDLFFKERGAWFLHQIILRKEAFAICSIECFANPEQWYPNTRNLTPPASGETPTKDNYGSDFFKIENDPVNPPDIVQEYKDWYGVDISGDEINISKETREKVIAAGQKWVKDHEAKHDVCDPK